MRVSSLIPLIIACTIVAQEDARLLDARGRPDFAPHLRALFPIDPSDTPSPTPTPSSSSTSPLQSSSSTTPQSTSSQTTSSSTSPSSAPPSSSSSSQQSSSGPPSTSSTSKDNSSSSPSSSSSSSSETSTSQTIDVITSTSSYSQTSSSTSSSPSSTGTGNPGGGGGGISTGTVVGLSVAAGIGALGVLAFIIWKMKKKRFSEFDDDDGNAIRWPDLDGASAMHPLPARPTGRSGIETNALERSEDAFDSRSLADSSTADLAVHPAANPYSQPLPPHGQQYYDDDVVGGAYPGAAPTAAAYYDPYRGPVPETISPARPPSQGDPYGAVHDPYGRAGSPGPHAAYDHDQQPAAAYGGGIPRTTSPGPNAAYGGGRTTSPGPDNAYGGYR